MVDSSQSFIFVLKHISGQANMVTNALCRRSFIIQGSQVRVLGFDYLKELYETDVDFQNVFKACQHPINQHSSPWK